MGSVVVEVQREALDRKVLVSDLLRKALVVARKLGLKDFEEWVSLELNGYRGGKDIPDYREIRGEVRAWNPYNGWIPVIFKDPEYGELCTRRRCAQSIAEIEHLDDRKEGEGLHMPFSQSTQRRLSQSMDFETQVSLFVDRSALIRILDAVRTIVLNWSLSLEEKGVRGEGMSFTTDEQEKALHTPQSVNNFYGPVQSAQIQQHSPEAVQIASTVPFDAAAIRDFLDAMRKHAETLHLDPLRQRELYAELRTVEVQLESPKPKRSILKESLSTLRAILEGAGSEVAAQLLLRLAGLGF